MQRIRVAGLAMLAMLALVAMSSTSASAFTQPEFTLEELIATSDNASSKLVDGSGTLTCTTTKSTHNASISSDLYEVTGIQIKYEGCSGSIGTTPCTSGKSITTEPLTGTLGTTSDSTTGIGLLLLPTTGKIFTVVECTKEASLEVRGDIAAEVSPTDKSGPTGTLTFTPSGSVDKITEIETSSGLHKKLALTVGGTNSSLEATDTESFSGGSGEDEVV